MFKGEGLVFQKADKVNLVRAGLKNMPQSLFQIE